MSSKTNSAVDAKPTSASVDLKGSAAAPKTSTPSISSITSPGVAAVTKGAHAAEAKTTAAEAKGESTLKSPPGWNATHDAFVKAASARGEDKASMALLVETEYPTLGHVSQAWIQSRLDAKA